MATHTKHLESFQTVGEGRGCCGMWLIKDEGRSSIPLSVNFKLTALSNQAIAVMDLMVHSSIAAEW